MDWIKKLIITSDKTIVDGNYLIDDKPIITGTNPNPTWEQIYYTKSYNKNKKGKRRLTWNSWKRVLKI